MIDPAFQKMIDGYVLVSAKIIYRLPDFPLLLQEFFRQEYDLLPEFPELRRFCKFWNESLDGPIHSVIVSSSGIIKPTEIGVARFLN